MQNSNNYSSRVKATAFVDFKPAELKQNKEWLIVYYAKNPATQNLNRIRLRVPVMNNQTERLKHAKRIILSINEKLISGWSPFFEESGKNYKSFEVAIAEFLKNIDRLVNDKVLRPDTKRTYNSNCNILKLFVAEKRKITFALEINRQFCVEYLDYIYLDRKSSPVTRNNHLLFLNIFCEYLLQRGVLGENPVKSISRMKVPNKKRVAFNTEIKNNISVYLKSLTGGFETLCMATYFCFIRNQELASIRVKDVDLINRNIFISEEFSKNKKNDFVTIPNAYFELIKLHIKNSDQECYLFSKNNFNVGFTKMPIRQIDTEWDKLRLALNLESKHQFYGFKDTGIQDLLNSGMPILKVRNQARHSDIKTTQIYAQNQNSADEAMKSVNWDF